MKQMVDWDQLYLRYYLADKSQGKSQTKLTKKKDEEMDKINEAAGERDSVKTGSAKYIKPDGKLGKALSGGPEQS